MRKTKVLDLGLASYREVWEKQEMLLNEIIRKRESGQEYCNYLLFVEHPHVFTLGKNGHEENLLEDRVKMMNDHVECIRVNRGGDITYHGPGQLVVYPIIDMQAFDLGVKDYVDGLEQVVINTIEAFDIKGERLKGATGVWLDPDKPTARKICAIGVKCSKYVTMHGLALNVNTDLSYFNWINPCGFVDKGVTSICKERNNTPLDMLVLKEEIKQNFVDYFRMEIE